MADPLVKTDSLVKTFTLDEYRRLILDASIIQQRDITLRETGEKLEHIIESEKLKLEQQDAKHRTIQNKLTIEDLYTAAKELGISAEYIDKILRNYSPTNEEIKKDLKEHGAVVSDEAQYPLCWERRARRLVELNAVVDLYQKELELTLADSFPFDKFKSESTFLKRYQRYKKMVNMHSNAGFSLFLYKTIPGFLFSETKNLSIILFSLLPSRELMQYSKGYIPEYSIRAPNNAYNSLLFHLELHAFDFMFLRGAGEKLKELNNRFSSQLVDYKVLAHYDAE